MRPLIVPARKMDFIIAYDSSTEEPAPGSGWVNGTTFGQTAKHAEALGIPYPKVPDAATFVNLGLNQYPVGQTIHMLIILHTNENTDLLWLQRLVRYAVSALRAKCAVVRVY